MSSNGDNPNNKGKAKEKDNTAPSTGHPASQDSSPDPCLLSRITTSTTTLTSSLLSGPPSNAILASATADKASSSSHPSAQIPHAESSSANFHPPPVSSTSSQPFRTTQSQSHAASEEAAFSSFLDDVPVFQPSSGPGETVSETWHMSTPDPLAVNVDWAPSSAREAAAHDGEAVISLLTNSDSHLPDTLVDDPLTPAQQTSLRQALFGHNPQDPGQDIVDWNHILNFIPPYLRHDEPSWEAYLDTGLGDPAEAWQSWVGQWEGVLNRYDDEVWGDLGGLVEEARREVEGLKKKTGAAIGEEEAEGGGKVETPALRRLRGILGHLRGY